MKRIPRRVAIAGLTGALISLALPAHAGSYLDRAALLVKHASQDADYLRARLSDLELASVIKQIAAARVQAASRMQVPKEVAQAHPHLLLVLENYERAATAAADGRPQRFLVLQQRARDEERILRGVLKQLGWSLPQA
jgi:hypothetical protein